MCFTLDDTSMRAFGDAVDQPVVAGQAEVARLDASRAAAKANGNGSSTPSTVIHSGCGMLAVLNTNR